MNCSEDIIPERPQLQESVAHNGRGRCNRGRGRGRGRSG